VHVPGILDGDGEGFYAPAHSGDAWSLGVTMLLVSGCHDEMKVSQRGGAAFVLSGAYFLSKLDACLAQCLSQTCGVLREAVRQGLFGGADGQSALALMPQDRIDDDRAVRILESAVLVAAGAQEGGAGAQQGGATFRGAAPRAVAAPPRKIFVD
jgi:hypothetical protein